MPTLVEALRAAHAGAGLDADVLLQHCELGPDAAPFAVVGLLGETVRGAEHVTAQAKPPVTVATVVPRRVSLHPVKEALLNLSG